MGMRSIKSNKLDFKKSCGRMAKGFPKRLAPLSSKTTFPNLTQVNFGVLEPFIRKMIQRYKKTDKKVKKWKIKNKGDYILNTD